jgi:hypothetical protein
LTPFFEEVSLTVNAVTPGSPYWFEPYLYAADRALFGSTPAVTLSQSGAPVLDEVMHAFYFSYYPLLISGIVIAWTGAARRRETPAPGFDTALTCMMLGIFQSYVWYPFLPARGPWENTALMAPLMFSRGWQWPRSRPRLASGYRANGGSRAGPACHLSLACERLVDVRKLRGAFRVARGGACSDHLMASTSGWWYKIEA